MGNDSKQHRTPLPQIDHVLSAAQQLPVDSEAATVPNDGHQPVRMPRAGDVIADRYTLEETLGKGTFGQVFSAWDSVRSHRVALKVLRHIEPNTLLRFKHEFRALNDLRHPHLVRVYKLGRDRGIWFIVMEQVHGTPFTQHASPHEDAGDAALHEDKTIVLTSGDTSASAREKDDPYNALSAHDYVEPRLDVYTLRHRLLQLCDGVYALHQTDIVHCDLKPSNILVTPEGRVVILDFGVAQNVSPLAAHEQHDGTHAGTRVYMPPEVDHSEKTTPAFDWYAVGMMLAELLTGYHATLLSNTPYSTLCALFENAKKHYPSYDALFAVYLRLLDPDPTQRAGHRDIRSACDAPPLTDHAPYHSKRALFGRTHELKQMLNAYARFVQGTPETLLIEGEQGMGKSLLCRHFLRAITLSDTPSYILFARCKSDELLGYRAFDEVVDGLAAVLRAIPSQERNALLQDCTPALFALFPALQSVAPNDLPDIQDLPPSPEDALYALHNLLTQVAKTRRIVIWVDDLDNADRDSLRWIARIFGPGARPNVFLLLSQRSRGTSPKETVDINTLGYAIQRVALAPFDPQSARDAIHHWLPAHLHRNAALVDDILTRAYGRPDVLETLCRHVSNAEGLAEDLRIEDVIQREIDALSALERELLQLIALAMEPIDIRSVLALCDAAPDTIDQALYWLTRKRFIRSATTIADEHYEIWGRGLYRSIRRSMTRDEQRAMHQRFADYGRTAGPHRMQPAVLIAHLTRAGAFEQAEHYALTRAQASERAGAWESASELYTLLLQVKNQQRIAPSAELLLRAVDCHFRTGRLAEAADLLATLARRSSGNEARSLHLRAANAYAQSGLYTQAQAHAEHAERRRDQRTILRNATPQLLRITALRAKLEWRLRRLDIHAVNNAPLDPTHQALMSTYRVSGVHVGFRDALSALEYAMQELDLALELNRCQPIAHALAGFSSFMASGNYAQQQRCLRWIERAEQLAHASLDQPTIEWVKIARATVDYQMGHYHQLPERLEAGHAWMTQHASHQSLVLSYLDAFRILVAITHGDTYLLRKIYYNQIADARVRNNKNAEASMTLTGFITWFIDDAPSAARDVMQRISWARPDHRSQYQLNHYLWTRSEADLALYEQSVPDYDRFLKEFRRFERAYLLKNASAVRDEGLFYQGRLLLARAQHHQHLRRKDANKLLHWSKQLCTSYTPLSQGWGHHLLAGLYYLMENTDRARLELGRSMDAHRAHGLDFFAELTLAAGQKSGIFTHASNPYTRLHRLGVLRPERLVQSYHPYV